MYSSLNYSVYNYVCTTLVVFMCTTLVLFVCTTLVVFVCTMVGERGRVAEKCHIQIFLFFPNFSAPFIYTSCANRAQLATAWSTGGTCTVCGHPTMSNYFTMYYYKIVGVAVLAFWLSLLLPTISYQCYFLLFK